MNLRPSGYEPDELPGCSTPRHQVGRCAEAARKRFVWPSCAASRQAGCSTPRHQVGRCARQPGSVLFDRLALQAGRRAAPPRVTRGCIGCGPVYVGPFCVQRTQKGPRIAALRAWPEGREYVNGFCSILLCSVGFNAWRRPTLPTLKR